MEGEDKTPEGSSKPHKKSAKKSSSKKKGKQSQSLQELKKNGQQQQRQEQRGGGDIAVQFAGLQITESPSYSPTQGTGLVCDDLVLKHFCPFGSNHGQAECPDRFKVVAEKFQQTGLKDRCIPVQMRDATDEELLLAHSQEYISKLKTISSMSDDELKSYAESFDSVYFCKDSFEIASKVSGGIMDLVHKVVKGEIRNGFAAVRPTSHHAGYNEANGYCMLNFTVMSCKKAVAEWGVKRILVVDWDVHHGQGTQRGVYDDPSVLYFSIHRYENKEFWPHLDESNFDHVGVGAGEGFNVNVPWNKVGMDDADYLGVLYQILLPMALEFNPELVIISAGIDAAVNDPKGEMAVSCPFFAHMTHLLMGLSGGKVVALLEGGYNLESLAEGAASTLRTLLGDPVPFPSSIAPPCQSAQETILSVIEHLQPYWKCFQVTVGYRYRDMIDEALKLCEERPLQITKSHTQNAAISTASHRACLVYDERMKKHKTLSHPEKPERIARIYKRHKEYGLVERCLYVEPRIATHEEIQLGHDLDHISDIVETKRMTGRELWAKQEKHNSIYINNDSYDCALLATGCLLNVTDKVLSGKAQTGVAIIRPPGHHAEPNKAGGFCFFNSVPIAALYALKNYHLQRILIIDWDIHHGNGTQRIVESDPRVLYLSLHRYDHGFFYPSGTYGDHTHAGVGEGEGYNINIAWNDFKMGDAEYMAAFQHVVMPIAYEFNPELVFVSAGFDAAEGDPLGGYHVSPACYGMMTHMLCSLAGGRVIIALEGGYNLNSIAESMAKCTCSLLKDPCPTFDPGQPNIAAMQSIIQTLTVHQRYWKSAAEQLICLQQIIKKTDLLLAKKKKVPTATLR